MRPKSATRIRTGCDRDMKTARIARRDATLRLNAKTQQGGSIHVELQDEHWNPHQGFRLDQSTPIHGNHLDAPITWTSTTQTVHGEPGRRLRLTVSNHSHGTQASRAVPSPFSSLSAHSSLSSGEPGRRTRRPESNHLPTDRPLVLRFQLDRATLYGFEVTT